MLKMSQSAARRSFHAKPRRRNPERRSQRNGDCCARHQLSAEIADFVNDFAWKGKVFDPEKGELRNKILPIGLNAITAKVYKGKSWLDQKECIVLDYSDTSLLAHWIRDEIREVAPAFTSGWSIGVKRS